MLGTLQGLLYVVSEQENELMLQFKIPLIKDVSVIDLCFQAETLYAL